MSTTRKQRRAQERSEQKLSKRDGGVVNEPHVAGRRWTAGLIVLSLAAGAGVGFFFAGVIHDSTIKSASAEPVVIRERPPLNLLRLVEMSDDELAKVDPGLMNLMCGDHLPRSGKSTVPDCVKQLDLLTDLVRQETSRNLHRWLENPAEFQNSEAYFKTAMLVTVLGRDYGAKYNPQKIETPSIQSLQNTSFYEDADDIFISGLLSEKRLGTCASMPVLAVAVGRWLGYPLKLVCAKAHLFFRWDDGNTRMNFEYTNGVVCHPDEHYRKWPFPISDAEVKAGWYLASLTPKQELSVYLALRADVLQFHHYYSGALKAIVHADSLWPDHPDNSIALSNAASRRLAELGVAQGPSAAYPVRSNIPPDPLRELNEMNALNALNQARTRATSPFPNSDSFNSGVPGSSQDDSFGALPPLFNPPSSSFNDNK